ncbi:hypothetical protein Q3G72_009773 [Acer saccharum]|nr:hypothetical protein Q3G72_009773 [Acer saccharum]
MVETIYDLLVTAASLSDLIGFRFVDPQLIDLLLLHHHHNLTFFKCVVCANTTKNDSPFCDSRVSCFDDNTSTIVKRMAVTTTKTDQAAIEANIEKKKEEEERESKKSTQPPPPPPPSEKPERGDWEWMRTMRTGCVLQEA